MQRFSAQHFLCLTLIFWSISAELAVAQKPLAEGVLKVIPSSINPRDSHTLPMSIPDLKSPSYDPVFLSKKDTLERLGQRNIFYNDVWEYELSIIPLRQALLNVPDLKFSTTTRKNIWYVIYRVRDRGNTLTYEKERQSAKLDYAMSSLKKDQPIPAEKKFFLPQFFLEGSVIADEKNAEYQTVSYHDKVIPMALRQIQQLHDPSLNLLDSIQMSQAKIPLAKNEADGGVWGVAMFEDVDSRLDYVNLKVEGLSNAFRISSIAGQPNLRKVLQINFSRPGGIINEHRDQINYGVPLVDDPQQQILITERYNLPGPTLCCYYINPDAADRRVLIAEVDAQVNLRDFTSDLAPTLAQNQMPATMVEALGLAGVKVDPNLTLEPIVPGRRWAFSNGDEKFSLALEPQYWEPILDPIRGNKIRFIKSLDYLWTYR